MQEASIPRCRVREGVDAKALCEGTPSPLEEHLKYSARLSAYLEPMKRHKEQMNAKACGAVVLVCGWLAELTMLT